MTVSEWFRDFLTLNFLAHVIFIHSSTKHFSKSPLLVLRQANACLRVYCVYVCVYVC